MDHTTNSDAGISGAGPVPGAGPIVVGIDGTDHGRRAFDVAVAIATRSAAPLHLVGAYATPIDAYTYSLQVSREYRRANAQNAQRVVEEFAEEARAEGLEVSTNVERAKPAALLVGESAKARLAVVGKRGRNRIAGRFLGSVSAAMASHAACPTLIVPAKWNNDDPDSLFAAAQEAIGDAEAEETLDLVTQSTPPKPSNRAFENVQDTNNFDQEMVVGIDLGGVAETVAMQAAEYAHMFQRRLTLISAAPLSVEMYGDPVPSLNSSDFPELQRNRIKLLEEISQKVQEAYPDLTVHWQFFDGSPAGILAEASRTATLVAVGTRGYGGFAGLLLGSVSQAVLNRAVSPVLVIPTKK